jgi:site-specific recombinase XerD
LYYSGINTQTSTIESTHQIRESEKNHQAVKVKDPWKTALDALSNTIQLRHYSIKTLKSYSLWAKKIRYFTNGKPPELFTPSDVRDFLTSLAVKQHVSASSQNQAFNALLFFFRHVLNKEFGKLDGVVRANGILTIHDGKGKKDRTVPLPKSIETELKAQIETVIALHEHDLNHGYGGAFMPDKPS